MSDIGIESALSYVHAFESSSDNVLAEARDMELSEFVLTEVSDLEIARGITPQFLEEELRFVPLSEVVMGKDVSFHTDSDMPALVWTIQLEQCNIRYYATQVFRVDCTSGAERISYRVLLKANQDQNGWLVQNVFRIQKTREQ